MVMHLLHARHRPGGGDPSCPSHSALSSRQADKHWATSNMVSRRERDRLSARLGVRKGFGADGRRGEGRAWRPGLCAWSGQH